MPVTFHRSQLPLRALLYAGLAGLCAASPAQAGMESAWSGPNDTAVRLLAGARDGDKLTGGVEIRLAPGWKTYWRYPGDSGVPPRFDWSGSENLGGVEILWPAPMRFDDGDGNYSIGYKHDIVLPFRVTPKEAGKPVRLKLDLEFAVCEKICQPAHATVTLDVPAEGAAPSSPAQLAAERTVPRVSEIGDGGPTGIDTVRLEDAKGVPMVRIEARVKNEAKSDLFIEGPDEDWALPLPTRQVAKDGRVVFLMPVDGVPKGADIASTGLRFTLIDGTSAVELDAPLSTH